MAHQVFICHSSTDANIANKLCDTLESFDVKCWIAPRDVLPGEIWGAAVVDAIDKTSIFIVILSRQSNESSQVVSEVERAAGKNKIIITFRIEDVVISKVLEYFLSSRHWLDAQSPPLEEHLERLAGTVKLHLDGKDAKKIKCPKCGVELRGDAIFCDMCGALVNKAKESKPTPKVLESIPKAPEPVAKAPEPIPKAPKPTPKELKTIAKEPKPIAKAPVCLNCGNELRPEAVFCNKCGAPVGTVAKPAAITRPSHCPSCGNELRPEAVFCNQCGIRIS